MVMNLFGAAYSGAFDALYQDKDYNAEVDLIERLFKRYGEKLEGDVASSDSSDHPAIVSVADFGCGTGNHAIRLARRGYQVVGVDRSDEMLAAAWVKTGSLPPLTEINFHHADVRTVRLEQTFDAVISMFGVLGYQARNDDLSAALDTVRLHLRPGGLFIFDVWYGPAVLHLRPSNRIKELRTGDTRLIRAATAELDTFQQTCHVDYHIWRFENDRMAGETQETHTVRYFFAQELAYFLEKSGLKLITLCSFPDGEQQPDETTWNVLGIAKAVST